MSDNPLAIINHMTKEIADNIALGMSFKDAALHSGINPSSLYSWRGLGRTEHEARQNGAEPNPTMDKYVELYLETEKAVPKRVRYLLGRIQQAAAGGDKTIDRRREYENGELVKEVITERTQLPQWTAAAWILERTDPEQFGRKSRVDVHNWKEEAIEHGIDPESMLREMADNIKAALRESEALDREESAVDAEFDDPTSDENNDDEE